jgi:elongation factor G
LFREIKVEADAGRPQIAYRDMITTEATGEGRFIRQFVCRGQQGHAIIKIEPAEKGKSVEAINEIVGGVIPKECMKSIQEDILEGVQTGVIAGYPVVNFVA